MPPDHDPTFDGNGHAHTHTDTHAPGHDRWADPPPARGTRPLRVGIGGPVGSGKTALVVALCRTLQRHHSVAVVTNDIYTEEDALIVRRSGVIDADRIVAVETGCCPHTAIRDDIAANLDAVDQLVQRHPDLDVVLVESGGDNLTATFSPALADVQLFVIDVAGGDKVPRKGGPGITRSDLLVINKTDLAPLVGADLAVMEADAERVRAGRPTLFTSLVEDPAGTTVASFVEGHLEGLAPLKAELRVEVADDRVVDLCLAPPLAAKVRHGRHGPVLVLVGAAASLLEDDVLRVAIDVGRASRLEVCSVAAQLAHPCLSGGTTRMEIDVRLGPGARLAWHPEPTIAYGGARHRADTRVSLGEGACAVWLEEMVLGCRADEVATVSLRTRMVVDGADGPLLRDGLDTDRPGAGGAAVLGGARHVGTLLALGRRLPDAIERDPDGGQLARFELAGEATLLRLAGGGTPGERTVLTRAAGRALAGLWPAGA